MQVEPTELSIAEVYAMQYDVIDRRSVIVSAIARNVYGFKPARMMKQLIWKDYKLYGLVVSLSRGFKDKDTDDKREALLFPILHESPLLKSKSYNAAKPPRTIPTAEELELIKELTNVFI